MEIRKKLTLYVPKQVHDAIVRRQQELATSTQMTVSINQIASAALRRGLTTSEARS